MHPELRICVKIFVYRQVCCQEPRISSTQLRLYVAFKRQRQYSSSIRPSRIPSTNVQQCSPIRHVRQESRQQVRICVTFNNAMSTVQLVTSSRISSKKLRVCVNFQITASARASGVNQCSIAFTTVVRAGNVVRMARASSWPDKSRQQRVVEVRRA